MVVRYVVYYASGCFLMVPKLTFMVFSTNFYTVRCRYDDQWRVTAIPTGVRLFFTFACLSHSMPSLLRRYAIHNTHTSEFRL